MGFLHPALLLFLVPVIVLWWRTRRWHPVTQVLRLGAAVLVVLALAGAYLRAGSEGRDLVVVVDRSRSMPQGAASQALERVRLAEEERSADDHLYVVSFGADARIEHASLGNERFSGFEADVDADGSDLASALDSALELVGRSRRGSILVVSDGESTGPDPVAVARRAFARGVRVDALEVDRPEVADLVVERIDLPGDVAVGEPFQFQVWVWSDRAVTSDYEMRRGNRVLSSGKRTFEPGRTRLVFRDVLRESGIAEYSITLGNEDDRVPENNRGLGAVRARGAESLLVLNHDGAVDTLVRALRAAGIPTAVAAPESVRLDPIGLSRYRAVILENVAADRVARHMHGLADWVQDHGGGLLMTGGEASFGIGGYYLSPIEDVLPVTMELRQEHRKLAVALAVALDRSGSMAAPVKGGATKMDLANLGTWEAIRLLTPMDAFAVIATDSRSHVIVELTSAGQAEAHKGHILAIESMGGGIFCFNALKSAVEQLQDASQTTRHMVLFADAADAEQPEGCFRLVEEMLQGHNTSTSVVALGTRGDTDATFLVELAQRGGGEAYFTTDPAQLPRLFAQDTLTVSRSTFIDDPTAVAVLPDLYGLGSLPADGFPTLTGYNLTYLRPTAQAGMATTDEYRSPVFAFQQVGLGRSAVFTAQIGGSKGEEVVGWPGFAEFFVTLSRWLVGQEEPTDVFADVRREGRDAVVTVELDPDSPLPADTGRLALRLADSGQGATETTLLRTGAHSFEVRVPLAKEGATVGTVALPDGRALPLPPLVLPYSPEFEHSPDPDRGGRLLRRLARETGGELGVSARGAWRGERGGRMWRLITQELILAALLLALVEIAGRRLSLWGSLRVPAVVGETLAAGRQRRATRRDAREARRALQARPPARGAAAPPTPAPAATTPPAGESPAGSAPPKAPAAPSAPAAPAAQDGQVGSALDRARRAANRKLGR